MEICQICKKECKSIKGLGSHITRVEKISHEEYYNKFLGEKRLCIICNKLARFDSINIGYREYCEDCKGIWISQKSTERVTLLNNIHGRSLSCLCEEYWLKKGYTKEEAKIEISKKQSTNSLKNNDKGELHLKEKATTCIEYWIKKGYTEQDAKKLVTERQTTFSLEKCIEKHGEEQGQIVWQERQDKWQANIKSKSEEETARINKAKVKNSNGSVSNAEKFLYKQLIDVGYNLETQLMLRYEGGYFLYDIADITKKKIIEYNGDYWHCNPKKYNEDYYHGKIHKLAKDIWMADQLKMDIAKHNGYDVFVVWEDEYKKDTEEMLNRCKLFLL